MIALPFQGAEGTGLIDGIEQTEKINYRLLVNQYDEELTFSFVDKGVPNRGIDLKDGCIDPDPMDPTGDADQLLVALDYQQVICQVAADDFPQSGKAGGPDKPIHHEPGLWLHMRDERTRGIDIARLATIPHGNSVLALGRSKDLEEKDFLTREAVNGLPIGYPMELDEAYMQPYKYFNDSPFKGTVTDPGFPGFNPLHPHELLKLANQGVKILKTTMLEVDSTIETGGIKNIPFIVKQANAASMKSTFWIQEIEEPDGFKKLRLQYLQIVLLDFFPREDGLPGLVRWPHVSINTLEKVSSQ